MLKLTQVGFSYSSDKNVISGLDLELGAGELLAVMGASGCGKSTLLNLIAGILRPSEGRLENRFQKTAYVFQEPGLFPWLTAEQNVRAVLPHKTDKTQASAIASGALEMVELTGDAGRYPDELSGGMKSRVALARAIAYGGDLLLLDEPFAALNGDLKKRILPRLKDRLKDTGAAAILVTHQYEDATAFADHIIELPSESC